MKPSGSSVELFLRCAYWTKFEEPDEVQSAAAGFGTRFHKAMQEVATCGIPGSDAGDDVLALRPVEVYQDVVPAGVSARAEVSYAFDFDTMTSRKLGENLGRDYGELCAGEIPGTADLVYTSGGRLVVVDWKTGDRFDASKYWGQVKFLLLCAMTPEHVEMEGVLVHVDNHGNVVVHRNLYSPMDLFEFASELKGRLEETGAPCDGIHCSRLYCKGVVACEKTQTALASLAGGDDSFSMRVMGREDIHGPEHVRWLVHRLAAIQAAHDHVLGVVKAYADEVGAVDLGDGLFYGAVKTPYSSIVGADPATLTEITGLEPERVLACMKPATVLKTALEREVKAAAPARKGAKAWSAVLNELAYRGMMGTREVVRHDIYKK